MEYQFDILVSVNSFVLLLRFLSCPRQNKKKQKKPTKKTSDNIKREALNMFKVNEALFLTVSLLLMVLKFLDYE